MRLVVKTTRHITRFVPLPMKDSRVSALARAGIEHLRFRAEQGRMREKNLRYARVFRVKNSVPAAARPPAEPAVSRVELQLFFHRWHRRALVSHNQTLRPAA